MGSNARAEVEELAADSERKECGRSDLHGKVLGENRSTKQRNQAGNGKTFYGSLVMDKSLGY